MAWQPIETAPRDGTKILAVCMKTASQCANRKGTMAVDFWHSGENGSFVGWGNFNGNYWPATHWMPLPEPPEHIISNDARTAMQFR